MFMRKIGWRAIFQMAEAVVLVVGSKVSTEEKIFNDLMIEIHFHHHLEESQFVQDEITIHDSDGRLVFRATRNRCKTFARDSFWINHLRDLAEAFKTLGSQS